MHQDFSRLITRLGTHALVGVSMVACAGVPPEPGGISNSPTEQPVTTTAAYAQIKQQFAALRSAPELSKAAIEQILGVILAPAASTQFLDSFEARPASGPFQKVELRQSKDSLGRLVTLQARGETEAAYKEFRGDLIPTSIGPDVNPDIPPEGEITFRFSDERPKQDLNFAFTARTYRFRGVSLQRGLE